MRWLEQHWYRRSVVSFLLWPLGWFYCLVSGVRRRLYRQGLLPSSRVLAPVIVVGNITVGGTGKTPLVVWLARFLKGRGYRPGVIARGYGGRSPAWPQLVEAGSDPDQVGDEPVLLARGCACPVMADPDRVRAGERLVREHGCNVVISDDGLQHYRLRRDIEIALIDGERRWGNGFCLPAGPLRESPRRLVETDVRLTLGAAEAGEWEMSYVESGFCRLGETESSAAAEYFRGRPAHALAGIAHPRRFFDHLRRLGLEVVEHPFPDHYRYTRKDVIFGDGLEVIMTEKDAVKCERLGEVAGWYLKVEARPDPRLGDYVRQRLEEMTRG
jgi:tetraacyldisaccharide 4'-kinase